MENLETSIGRITTAEEGVVPMDVHHGIAIETTNIGEKHQHAQPVPQQGTEVAALQGLLLAKHGYGEKLVISAAELKALQERSKRVLS